jgi:hypothetical protein
MRNTFRNVGSAFFLLFIIYSCKKENPPKVTTIDVTEISYTTASSGGEVIDDGGATVITRGVCYNTSPDPTVFDSKSVEAGGLGSFNCSITQLTPSTTYYIKAYATNSAGTGYGDQVSFTTTQAGIPILTTTVVTSVTQNSAISGGNITAENGGVVLERGVCWGTVVNPTISNNKTSDGTGSGTFTSNMTGLQPGFVYYLRSYATNSVGTAYGNGVSFTTLLDNSSSAAKIDSIVIDMYKAAQLGYYTGGAQRGYPFGAATIEQGDCRGEDAVNLQAFFQITYEGTYTTLTPNNVYMWISTYRLINRCNIVIDKANKAKNDGIITVQKALIIEGEARFFRALAYHELLIHFARPYKYTGGASHDGVTIHEKLISTLIPEILVMGSGRSTVAEVYTKIISDLNFAETSLPLKSSLSGRAQITKATSGAAIALKTRIYQHMWDWSNVIAEGQKLLNQQSGDGYSLTTNPDGPFLNNYSNTESIFSMENTPTSNPTTNGSLSQLYNGKGRALVCISPIIWRNPSWRSDDKRRGTTMCYSLNGVIFTEKYKDFNLFTDATPLIRYAEVLLNIAEAYTRRNNSGDFTLGLSYLNLVRNRSLFNPSNQAYTSSSFSDNQALIDAILIERRIEFVMEGRRWPDLHRLQLDIPAKIANANPPVSSFTLGSAYTGPFGIESVSYANYKFLWPIPQKEVDADPSFISLQNPGW